MFFKCFREDNSAAWIKGRREEDAARTVLVQVAERTHLIAENCAYFWQEK